MKLTKTRLFPYFLAALFLINLLQSHFTELLFDEAYYWYYAREMAWGYFDHPPMVALLIKIGGFFFDGELGVRFMSCVLSIGTAGILWKLIEHPRKSDYIPHFFALLFSMTLLNAYGFFTLPDTPLLFFTAVFLLVYKQFLQKETLGVAVMLGLVMAALMYSKYHAVLVIVFVLLSNLKLVFNKYAWLAVAVALLAYIPHFIWLVEHDFISIRYHLFERPNRAYDFSDFTLGYLINLVALFGLTFPWIYQALFKTKAGDKFTRSMVFLVYGVLLFFFLSSFQRRVQTQWIIVICIPLAIIVYRYMLEHKGHRKWIMRMAIANIAILLVLRVGLIYPGLFPIHFETHGNREWVAKVKAAAEGAPVIFENSYREAPMYEFYSGQESYSLNNLFYRENQYNIDGSELDFQGKKVLYIAKRYKDGDIGYTTAGGNRIFGKFHSNFQSLRELECEITPKKGSWHEGPVEVRVRNPYDKAVPLDKLEFGVAFLNAYKEYEHLEKVTLRPVEGGLSSLPPQSETRFLFEMPEAEKLDPAYFRMAISEYGLIWGLNSRNVKVNVWNP